MGMLDTVDLEAKVVKEDYKPRKDELVARLASLQQQAHAAELPVIVVFEGWDAAGKGSRISDLVANLDPRLFLVHVTGKPIGYEGRLPFMQRFWEKVGSHGTMSIFDQSWYRRAVHVLTEPDSTKKKKRRAKEFGQSLDHLGSAYGAEGAGDVSEVEALASSIVSFEKQFADDGYTIVKFFLHISEAEQKRRLDKLEADPATKWRVTKKDRRHNRYYKQLYKAANVLLEKTDYDFAPWHIVASTDSRSANLQIMETLAQAIEEGIARKKEHTAAAKAQSEARAQLEPLAQIGDASEIVSRFPLVKVATLADVSHDLTLDADSYRAQLKAEQKKLARYGQLLHEEQIPMLVALEGWDAAGKGGAIKRIARALDARGYRVVPSSSPTWDEKHHPFLWRYWTNLPRTGHVAIYDRTWYGRVLVERVEGFATQAEWQRAYDEINEFEWELQQWGAILVKFWVDVSSDEQLARFKARQADPAKQYKITDEDWRNREKSDLYHVCIDDMLRLTSTEYAPWQIVESDCKYYARVKALKAVNAAVEKRLGL